uniref:Uncharacterized protein n=1 Tax=Ditylenchus dipsaci TaxID=166011 RepID=A0A915DY66_9BILA
MVTFIITVLLLRMCVVSAQHSNEETCRMKREQTQARLYSSVKMIDVLMVVTFFIALSVSIIANVLAWLLLWLVCVKMNRTLCSVHQKLAIGDALLQRRRLPGKLLEKLSAQAEFDLVKNEMEATRMIKLVHSTLAFGGHAQELVYSPDEVYEFHHNKHKLWSCSSEISSEASKEKLVESDVEPIDPSE